MSLPPEAASRSTDVTVVLVHGAFADASSWNGVIPSLQQRGLSVIAPPNPLGGWPPIPRTRRSCSARLTARFCWSATPTAER
jgi:pimeloyl-ACP methyl ester carboxylesterase